MPDNFVGCTYTFLAFFGVIFIIVAIAVAYIDIVQHGDAPPAVILIFLSLGIICLIPFIKEWRKD